MTKLKKAPLPATLSINQLAITPFVPDGVTSNVLQFQTAASVMGQAGPEVSVPVTITVGNPTVVALNTSASSGGTLTDNTHYLKPNQAFYFTAASGATIPSGMSLYTFYYITSANLLAKSFTFTTVNNYSVLTNEGAPVATTGTASGTISIVLTGRDLNVFIPPGPYFCGLFGDSNASVWATPNGITRVRYHAYGAMFDTKVSLGTYRAMGDAKTWASQVYDLVNTTPNELVTANLDATVTLQTIANAANYYVGQWITIFGLDLQNPLGHYASGPPNNHYQEYKKIKAINLSTGVLTFDGPFKWIYLSTFPALFNATGQIGGGPALIAQMHPCWDTEVEIRGARWTAQPTEQVARKLSFIDCVFQGYGDFAAQQPGTETQELRYKNCVFGPAGGAQVLEIDKMFEYLEFDGCDMFNHFNISFVSPSVHNCLIKSQKGAKINGTPRRIKIESSEIDSIFVGPLIGVSDSVKLDSSVVGYFDMVNRVDDLSGTSSLSTNNDMTLVPNWTFSGGTFTRNITGLPIQLNMGWQIPGAKIYFADAGKTYNYKQNMGSVFEILNVNLDGAGNFSFDTTLSAVPTRQTSATVTITIGNPAVVTGMTLANGTPVVLTTTGVLPTGLSYSKLYFVVGTSGNTCNLSLTVGGTAITTSGSQNGTHTMYANPLQFRPHPCPRFTCVSSAGCAAVTDLNGAVDEPLFSRVRRAFGGKQYTGSASAFEQPNPPIWGVLDNTKNGMTVNVVRAGTAGTLNITCPGFTQPNLALSTFSQTIDLTVAGIRTVTTTATTGSAGSDSIAAYGDWVAGPLIFQATGTSSTLANNAVVYFEMYTDQQITRFGNMQGAPATPSSGTFVWMWNDSGIIQQYGTTP